MNINRDFEYSLSIEIIRTRFSENISSECMMYYVDALRFFMLMHNKDKFLSSPVIIIQSMSKEEDQIDQALAQMERTVYGRLPHKTEVQKAILRLDPFGEVRAE